jgi:hypothetical protein
MKRIPERQAVVVAVVVEEPDSGMPVRETEWMNYETDHRNSTARTQVVEAASIAGTAVAVVGGGGLPLLPGDYWEWASRGFGG